MPDYHKGRGGGKCGFHKNNGDRCGADAQSGKRLCVFHDPTKADEVHRARRAGGISRARRAAFPLSDTPDVSLTSTPDVPKLLGESINQVRRGEIEPRVANAIGYLSGILLKCLEQGSVEERLARLESVLRTRDVPGFEFAPRESS